MMRVLLASAALVGTLAIAGAASAQSPWAVTGGIGTDGVGGGVLYKLSPHFVLSGRLAGGPDYTDSGDSFGFHVKGHTNLSGATGAIEWHPYTAGSPWMTPGFLALGVFYGFDRDVPITGSYVGAPVIISGVSVGGPQIGALRGKGSVDSAIPVIGIGWDNTFTTSSRWGYRVFGGVGFGDAKVTSLAASGGTYSTNVNVVSTVAAVRAGIDNSDQFEALSTYPVVSASVTYKF